MRCTNVVNIINALRQQPIHIRGVGSVILYDDSITVGNNAVIARCHIVGIEGDKVIKCYFREKHNTALIYGDNFYHDALDVYSIDGSITSIDIVIKDWYDGETLNKYILRPECDFKLLSHNFDTMATDIIASECAHGDICPDNIIIRDDGSIYLVDLDASWSEEIEELRAEESGTSEFNNRLRPIMRSNKHIDDYAIASISVMLATLSADSSMLKEFTKYGTLQLCIEDNDNILDTIADILFRAGDMSHYDIVSTIKTFGGKIYNIDKLIGKTLLNA